MLIVDIIMTNITELHDRELVLALTREENSAAGNHVVLRRFTLLKG